MTEFLTFKTSQPAGDLISMLPSFRQLFRQTGKKCLIYQALNVPGQGVHDQPQPFKNEQGESIMMGEETFKMLIPLLKSQEYIQDLLEFKGEKVQYDMDEIRLKTFVNQPYGSINRWSFYIFPEMACDLSEQWLCGIKKIEKYIRIQLQGHEPTGKNVAFYGDKVILNFTNRYRNNWMNYFFLKQCEDKLMFSGLTKEHTEFCKRWDLNIPLLKINDFYDLAVILSSCKFFLGCQSMMFQIAEGLKIPRLLETSQIAPNVIPMGKNGYDAYHQQAMEFYVNKLIQ